MGVLTFAGCETGDLSEFSTIVGTVSADTSIKRSGAYSLKCAGTTSEAKAHLTFADQTETFSRAWMYFNLVTPPSPSSAFRAMLNVLTAAANSTGQINHVTTSAGVVQLGMYDVTDTLLGPLIPVNQNQWYLVELHVVASASVGVLEWWLNGVLIASFSGRNTGAAALTNQMHRAVIDTGAITIYYDDIMIRNDIRCGPGSCMARQGLAGTPTYDTFTKVVGATAQECWSETPYSATKACTSITSGGAQTMLGESFAITQAGHGSNILGSGNETINAIKVGMVGKVAVATSHSIRYRAAGADTDTSKSITTADAYYETAPFTDTIANLNSSEIGVLHGANTNLLTIEDMWTMVDYSVPGHTYVPNKLRPYPFAPGVAR